MIHPSSCEAGPQRLASVAPLSPLPSSPLLAGLLLVLAVGSLGAQGTREVVGNGTANSTRAAATMHVEPVTRVEPSGRLTIRLAATEKTMRVACAANVQHRLDLHRAGGSLPDGSVEWSADGGRTWSAVRPDPTAVRVALPPGRLEACATVSFRLRSDGTNSSRSGEVVVRFRIRPDRVERGVERAEPGRLGS